MYTKRSYKRPYLKRKSTKHMRSKHRHRGKIRITKRYLLKQKKRTKRYRGGDNSDTDGLSILVDKLNKRLPMIKAKLHTGSPLDISDEELINNVSKLMIGKSGTTVDVNGQSFTKTSCPMSVFNSGKRNECEESKKTNYIKVSNIFDELKQYNAIPKEIDLYSFNKAIESKIGKRSKYAVKPIQDESDAPIETGFNDPNFRLYPV